MIKTNIPNSALYYPSIEFVDPSWLWASSLLWDRIYRIVPKDYIPEDSENIKRLAETGEIGVPIQPDEYAKEVSDKFLEKLQTRHWDAAALSGSVEGYSRLHHDKVDVRLREMIVAKGSGASHEDWLYVPTEYGALYMTYLARYIARKSGLNLVTDVAAAWTGSTYFSYDGRIQDCPMKDDPHVLAAMIIRDFIPTNITDITPADLLSFRDKRRDERQQFMIAVKNAAESLANCHDAKVARDMYEDLKRDIESNLKEYRKSMDILKVEGWTGLKTLTFPATTGVIGKLIALDPTQLAIFATAGAAMGVVCGLSSMAQKGKKLDSEYDYSYLLHIRRNWQKCYRGEDWNYFLCRQMEEFIND